MIITVDAEEMIQAAYQWMRHTGHLKRPPDGKHWHYTPWWDNAEKRVGLHLNFELKDNEPEPEPEPYEAGNWRDPELLTLQS